MKLKQQASGWPSECDTEEKRRTYLDDYKAHEGIELDPAKVEKNPTILIKSQDVPPKKPSKQCPRIKCTNSINV